MLKPLLQGQYLRSLKELDLFEAQRQLEDTLYGSYAAKLLTLSLDNTSVSLEYARVRGALEALNQMRSARDQLINSAVESKLNS